MEQVLVEIRANGNTYRIIKKDNLYQLQIEETHISSEFKEKIQGAWLDLISAEYQKDRTSSLLAGKVLGVNMAKGGNSTLIDILDELEIHNKKCLVFSCSKIGVVDLKRETVLLPPIFLDSNSCGDTLNNLYIIVRIEDGFFGLYDICNNKFSDLKYADSLIGKLKEKSYHISYGFNEDYIEDLICLYGETPVEIKGDNKENVKRLAEEQAKQFIKLDDPEFKEICNLSWNKYSDTLIVNYLDCYGCNVNYTFELYENDGILNSYI